VRDFALGTFLGMFPGLLMMTLFGDRLQDAIRDPTVEGFMILAALGATIVLMTVWMRQRFARTNAGAGLGSARDKEQRARLRCGHSTKNR
jgi:uncharacterized membrane protein YdjX (TVP38/TMEM64 family)